MSRCPLKHSSEEKMLSHLSWQTTSDTQKKLNTMHDDSCLGGAMSKPIVSYRSLVVRFVIAFGISFQSFWSFQFLLLSLSHSHVHITCLRAMMTKEREREHACVCERESLRISREKPQGSSRSLIREKSPYTPFNSSNFLSGSNVAW